MPYREENIYRPDLDFLKLPSKLSPGDESKSFG